MMGGMVVMVVRTGRGGASGGEDAEGDRSSEDALHFNVLPGTNRARHSRPDDCWFNLCIMSGR